MSRPPELADLLVAHGAELVRILRSEGSGLLRFESDEDLAQGVHERALAHADGFRYDGEAAFKAWLRTLARRHVADRHAYWRALKRGSGRVLRLTWGTASGDSASARMPAGETPGPATFAARRELLELAVRAISALPPRDAELVRWAADGVPLREQAARRALSYAAIQRAAHRAQGRFQKAFELLRRSSGG